MIQYYTDLDRQIKSIKELNLSQGQIQKIYSTAFYVSISIRAPGKTWHLYFGRGAGHEGVWFHDTPPPSALRRKDNFLEYLRHHLSSCSYLGIQIDLSDRIVCFDYQKFGKKNSILLFWKGRTLYFVHYFQETPESPMKLLLSWKGKAHSTNGEEIDLFSCFDEIGRSKSLNHSEHSRPIEEIDKLMQAELELAQSKKLGINPGFLHKKKNNIEDDLRRAKQWNRLQEILDKNVELTGHVLEIGDHKIKFEGPLNPYEKRNLIFEKIKKLKKGEDILEKRLMAVNEELEGKSKNREVSSELPIIRPTWGKSDEPTQKIRSPSAYEFKILKIDGNEFGIGLSAHGNDQLRNSWGKKDDFWIHLDNNLKSAHLVIKTNTTPTQEMINIAASIVAHFSHFEGDWIPIIYTQVKNLKGVTGAPGMVTYKKQKHLRCLRVNVADMLEGIL